MLYPWGSSGCSSAACLQLGDLQLMPWLGLPSWESSSCSPPLQHCFCSGLDLSLAEALQQLQCRQKRPCLWETAAMPLGCFCLCFLLARGPPP